MCSETELADRITTMVHVYREENDSYPDTVFVPFRVAAMAGLIDVDGHVKFERYMDMIMKICAGNKISVGRVVTEPTIVEGGS